LSDTKFLAKVASDLDKPHGFAMLSRSEAAIFLADKLVTMLWVVSAATHRRLAGDGSAEIGQLAMLGSVNSPPAMAASARAWPGSRAARTSAPSTRALWRTRSWQKPPV
jgi:hypothetical protein